MTIKKQQQKKKNQQQCFKRKRNSIHYKTKGKKRNAYNLEIGNWFSSGQSAA